MQSKRMPMLSALPLPVLLIALCLSGCASSHRPDLASLNMRDTLQVLAEQHHVCGVAVAVIRQRQLASIDSASGCTPAPKVDANSVFQAASLSKPVFAYAVLKLAAQGKLELDAPLMRYLPQGYRHQFDPLKAQPSELVTDPRLAAITVRMVLNHTSGLPNWASGPLRFEAAPGTAWHYSGEGYVLLQRAVEAVSGQRLDQFMRAQVFTPLGMTHSDYAWSERIAPNLMPGSKANGAPRAGLALNEPNAAFSLHTSAADYGKFLVALLGDDEILAQLSASPVPVDAGLGLDWGLQWGIERDRDASYIWHWGNNTGYRAFVMASVRTGDGFVMLTNSENGLELAQPLAQKIVPGEHKLFQSPILGTDMLNVLCNTLHICL
ncbi:beta-lactamase family protein [Massilia sp. CCM 8692]|uniref:Beta-lactamase family protein n=2 Tax=Massilia rubra TaxID=2607910 RepID=A0ABX0M102_9BURK|nr:beta-lactamase family protein [Massilia rubra]